MIAELEKHLPRPVQEVITEFPALVNVLNEYDIGCGSCMVGSCLLKDIVSIHGLPPARESALMDRITELISPSGKPVAPPMPQMPQPQTARDYSTPIKRLVDEHLLIKKLLALIPEIIARMNLMSQAGRQRVADGMDFISSYADRFHHGKEEDILFKYFDEQSEIIQIMHSDHETGRSHVRAVREALAKGEGKVVADHLLAYRDLLLEHIKKEDEILFPWMDKNLSVADKNKLVQQFNGAENGMGVDIPTKYGKLIAALEADLAAS